LKKKSRSLLLDFFLPNCSSLKERQGVDQGMNFKYKDNALLALIGQSKGQALIVGAKEIENHEKGGDDEAY
jgi:hypothetical protein